MNFKDFIKALRTGMRRPNQVEYVIGLFCAADPSLMNGPLFDAHDKIKNWTSGRNKGYEYVFSGYSFDDSSFIEYLRTRPQGTSWEEVQSALMALDNYNFKPKDADEFWQYVTNQFKALVMYSPVFAPPPAHEDPVHYKGELVFGRNAIIKEITARIERPNGEIIEILGLPGIGKSTVCEIALNRIDAKSITVDIRDYNTLHSIQEFILGKFGDSSSFSCGEVEEGLIEKAKTGTGVLYLDNVESIAYKDAGGFTHWIRKFSKDSGWNVMYSTQITLEMDCCSYKIEPLGPYYAKEYFIQRWGNTSDEALVHEIAIELLSGIPLAIKLATSPMQKNRTPSLTELKQAIEINNLASANGGNRIFMKFILSTLDNQARVLYSVIAQFPGEFSLDLFKLAFHDDLDSFTDARTLLIQNCLIDGKYNMLAYVKEQAFYFEEAVKSKATGMLCRAFERILCKTGEPQTNEWQKQQKTIKKNLSSLLLFLSNLSEKEHELHKNISRIVHSAKSYYHFSARQSLETLNIIKQIYENLDLRLELARVYSYIGDIERSVGSTEAAYRCFTRARDLFQAEKDNEGVLHTLICMGDLERRLGNLENASKYYNEAENSCDKENKLEWAHLLISIGKIEKKYGNSQKAKQCYAKASELFDAISNTDGRAYMLKLLGDLEREDGSNDEALDFYMEAQELYSIGIDNLGIAYLHVARGLLECQFGNYNDAQEFYKSAEELFCELFVMEGANRGLALVLRSRGELILQKAETGGSHHPEEAIGLLKRACRMYKKEKMPLEIIKTMSVLSYAFALRGSFKESREYSTKAKESASLLITHMNAFESNYINSYIGKADALDNM